MALRKIVRKPVVLAATGYSNSTLYKKIQDGKFPKPVKLDPDDKSGRAASGWFEDEVEDYQRRLDDTRNAELVAQK
jgi:prophage regulatory protein